MAVEYFNLHMNHKLFINPLFFRISKLFTFISNFLKIHIDKSFYSQLLF